VARVPVRNLFPESCQILGSALHFDEIPGGLGSLQAAVRDDLLELAHRFPGAVLDRAKLDKPKSIRRYDWLAVLDLLSDGLPSSEGLEMRAPPTK
jgi:hypothetical protein